MFRNPTTDIIVVLVIVLLFFGPKRLPTLGKSLGSGIREFKDSITGHSHDDDDEDGERPTLAAGASLNTAQEPVAAPQSEPSSAQAPREHA